MRNFFSLEDVAVIFKRASFFVLVAQESVSVVVSRQLISDLCGKLAIFDAASAKIICSFALEKLQSRAISFEEQVNYHTLKM